MTYYFVARRRQQFLYEKLYLNTRLEQQLNIRIQRENLAGDAEEYGLGSLAATNDQAYIYHETFWLWMLDYTSGDDLHKLATRFAEVVDEFIEWHRINVLFRKAVKTKYPDREIDVDASPVDFDNQVTFEDALQLISVAIILRDSRSVQRIIEAMASNRYRDALFESLIAGYVEDPQEGFEEVIHENPPYMLLVEMMYEDDESKLIKQLNKYLKNWYKAQAGARWFDAHLQIVDDKSAYCGYWSFEAGAVAYLLDLDDSSIDHMVYPKDLVAYGKKLREEDRWTLPEEPLKQGSMGSD